MGKREALPRWLDRAVDTPCDWGVHDCTIWPANWVVQCGGGDPAAAWRGRYRTLLGAARLASAAGGMVALYGAACRSAGLKPTGRPLLGDVGLLSLPARAGPTLAGSVGGIAIGGGDWAVVQEHGLWIGRAAVIAAWRVEWRTR